MINLVRRYPDSKPEDITDAFSRGVICGMEVWRGTCSMSDEGYGYPFTCSVCGARFDFDSVGDEGVNYCPNCGRKVVDDASVD